MAIAVFASKVVVNMSVFRQTHPHDRVAFYANSIVSRFCPWLFSSPTESITLSASHSFSISFSSRCNSSASLMTCSRFTRLSPRLILRKMETIIAFYIFLSIKSTSNTACSFSSCGASFGRHATIKRMEAEMTE